MTTRKTLAAAFAAIAALASSLNAQISYTSGTITENFNTLPTTSVAGAFPLPAGTHSAIPGVPSWAGTKVTGTGTVAANLTADTGAANSGALYSYGAAGDPERSLGAIASASNIMALGTEIVNNSGGTISAVTISFRSEFWRSSTSTQNRLVFAYGVSGGAANSSNYLTHASLIAVTNLDVVGPVPVATNGPLNGNDPANQAAVSFTINGLSIPNGASLYLRWTDANDAGNDAGLAIDDFSFTAVVSTGGDVSRGAGTDFTPSSFGGNAFTVNDTAVFDGPAATVNLVGNVLATALKFTTDAYTLAGSAPNSIALSGGITVNSGVNATISGVIAGSNGLTKLGTGGLTLSGINTFTGTVNNTSGVIAISADANLGDAGNDIINTGTLSLPAGFSFGAGRDISGSGTLSLGSLGALTINGSLGAGAFNISNVNSLTLAGGTNAPSSLTFDAPLNLNISGGALAPTSGLTFNQTSGSTIISGPLNITAAGDRSLVVAGGSLLPTGTFGIGTGRFIKTGAGELNLVLTTLTTGSPTTGGFRLGVQGATPLEGGTLFIDEATDLGNAQLQFNSGALQVNAPITTAVGLSVGGRFNSSVSTPTFRGSPITFNGNSSFFLAAGASGDLGLVVNSAVTIAGTVGRTTAPTVAVPNPAINWIDLSGTGSLKFSGDAGALLDRFYVNGGASLIIDGTLGGERIQIAGGSSLSGGGTYRGYYNDSTVAGVTAYLPSTLIIESGAVVDPTGVLTVLASASLDAGSILRLNINGTTRVTDYDGWDVGVAAGSGLTNTLDLNGALEINFGSTAIAGTYSLVPAAAGVTRSGTFSSVTLTGAHSLPLTFSGGTWQGTGGLHTFSFDPATGVLTVTGGEVAPVITSALTASATVGIPFSYTITASNSPTSFSSSPLPVFLTFNATTGVISGSAANAGVYNIDITATNAGGSDTKTLVLTVTTPLQNWRLAYFGSTDNSGNGADGNDFDGDGLSNLHEYAFGSNPTIASANPVVLGRTGDGQFLTLTFPRVNDPALTYSVWATNDMAAAFTSTGFGVNGGTTSETYTDNVAVNVAGARRFLQVRISY